MKTYYSFRYNLLMTTLMCLFTMAKVCFLYIAAIAPASTALAYFRTGLALLFFYILLNHILFVRSFIPRLIFHELLAVLILADIMYFRYFNSLPSIDELKMIDALPDVWSSIAELFKPEFLLLFADILILSLLHFLFKTKSKSEIPRTKASTILSLTLAVILSIDSITFGTGNSYHIFDSFGLVHFHFVQTIEAVTDKDAAELNYASMSPIKDTGVKKRTAHKYQGIAKGRNVIVIQVEALQNFVINRFYEGQELTPNLNKLIKQDSIYFDRYYQNTGRGNTADAEFVSQHSLYPGLNIPSYKKYKDATLYGLPKILKGQGYSTTAFHAYKPEFWDRNTIYPLIGFDKFISQQDFVEDEVIGWGVSDSSFFKQAAKYIEETPKPFYGFLVTLSSHHPFNIPEEFRKIELKSEHKDTLLGNYLNAINYADYSLGVFIDSLKKSELYDDSVIAIYGDHQGIFYQDSNNQEIMTELLGCSYDADIMTNIPLIIHIPGAGITDKISIPGGHLDFTPTLLNLMDIEDPKTKFYGQDLCNADQGFATIQLYLPKGSFIDNERVYIASSDGVFEHGRAWDFKTKQPIDLEACRSGYDRAIKEMDECNYLLTNNLLDNEQVNIEPLKKNDSSFYVNPKHMAQLFMKDSFN